MKTYSIVQFSRDHGSYPIMSIIVFFLGQFASFADYGFRCCIFIFAVFLFLVLFNT